MVKREMISRVAALLG